MKTVMEHHSLIISTLCGLLVPTIAYVIFGLFWCLKPARFPLNWFPDLLKCSLAIIEVLLEYPAVAIGRSLSLPVDGLGQSSGFFVFSLSPFGYLFVFAFWVAAGLIVGWMFAMAK